MSSISSFKETSSSGGESSSSSRRPKISVAGRTTRVSGFSARNSASHGNPLGRLCDCILSWDIMDDACQNLSPKSFDWVRDHSTIEPVSVLPNVYLSYSSYVEAWEPLMIREVQESLISKFSSLMSSTVSGTFHCTVVPDRGTEGETIHLECSFNNDQVNG